MSEQRTILVTGATGKQGRAVIDALRSLPAQSSGLFHVLAMARDPSSSSAQRLAALTNVTVIKGDLADMPAVFSSYGKPVWGVYSVQINSDSEIEQGKAVVDASVAAGVKHFVYASGDRGGPELSDRDPTTVKNFAAKFQLEKILESSASKIGMTYTILRPVSFMENQALDRHGQGFARMWMQMSNGERKLQIVSTRDIGFFAAQAFANPTSEDYRNKALSIAGDELSGKEAEKVFKEVTGKDFPMAPCLIGKAVKFFLSDTVGDMFEWFDAHGYGADVAECRRKNPGMLDYRTWLKEHSGFV